MAYYISSFISPFGMILINILDGGEEPALKLTTEVLTGHVAVYHGDQIWRVEANPDWSLGETAQALSDLAFEAEIPEELRTLGIAALQNCVSDLYRRQPFVTA
ncbi:hypothetical protein MAA5396_04831 [Marinovum algicola]|uniref:Uncharacterized protein n=1 Tax=Marinovum algicola TaxID=42444 RepID=A0A975WF72_9RHOB|nr:hypothetical protein [Marinovum algicola]SEK10326.1 hypothetical protein SAMN04487940_13241 [Marinovum algicola]SLN76860.1 hypothetical protein MAA5396_04831 [Marinovum algicola]